MSRWRSKEIRRQTDPSIKNTALEAHHWKVAKRHGGEDTQDNMFSLTRPEHALVHHLEAGINAKNGNHHESTINRRACRCIIGRMGKYEKMAFSDMANQSLKRRRG